MRVRAAFTIVELLVTVAIIGLLMSILIPAITGARDRARLMQSMTNLRNLGTAHAAYAASYNDRQLTYVVDSITTYGAATCDAYTNYAEVSEGTHPNIVLGWGPSSYGSTAPLVLWQYRLDGSMWQNHCWAGEPIARSGNPHIVGWGHFRFGHQARSFSPFLNGRFYDPVFFAPKDVLLYDIVKDGFDAPSEFAMIPADDGTTEGGLLYTSSYSLSPAAMYSPQVFEWDPDTGKAYRNPWQLPAGLRSPSPSHSLYPALKTRMLEHYWLQNRPAACNPGFVSPGAFEGCEPYFFNHGHNSVPTTLFYDGHVEGLGVREAEHADARHLEQAGYGLWSRDTTFGSNGFFIHFGYDQADTSFHILTTDGIRGRDTVSR